jgi:hypothetical protein
VLGIYVDGTPREIPLTPRTPTSAVHRRRHRCGRGNRFQAGRRRPGYDHTLKSQIDYLYAHPTYVFIDEILPVTAGLRLWLRADEAVADGDQQPVAIWADRSGQALHVAQSDPAAQPRFIERALDWNPAVR